MGLLVSCMAVIFHTYHTLSVANVLVKLTAYVVLLVLVVVNVGVARAIYSSIRYAWEGVVWVRGGGGACVAGVAAAQRTPRLTCTCKRVRSAGPPTPPTPRQASLQPRSLSIAVTSNGINF